MLVFLDEEDGGERPIGLLAGLVRLWGRVRKPCIQDWAIANGRPYFWASRGRSSEACAWRQQVMAAAAREKGLRSGAALLDLSKAYE
eukprot:11216137-Lingulodinium_polyedra.AAC.1